jgi:O-antigen/teichoic acid export membrane protein
MKLPRNLVYGLGASAFAALMSLAVVPLYLKFLGVEAYGLLGVSASMAALFSLLDLGLAPAMSREAARARALGAMELSRDLLASLEKLFAAMAIAIAIFAVIAAPLIATNWLDPRHLGIESTIRAVALIGVAIACRWPLALYTAALLGAERVPQVSVITVAASFCSNAGAIGLLAWVDQSIEALFAWQAFIGFLHMLAMRQAAVRAIGRSSSTASLLEPIRRIWKFSLGAAGVSVTALILTQVDKVVLSGILSLDSFGEYTIASMVASAIYLLVNPTYNVIYPRLVALTATADKADIEAAYRAATRTFASLVFPLCSVLAVFAGPLVAAWTGNEPLSRSVAPVISLLAAAVALHSVMYFPYALQLAAGAVQLPLKINSILVLLAVPLMALLAARFGTIGGALALLLLYSIYLLLGTWMTHRLLLKGLALRWLCVDVGIALAVSLAVAAVGTQALKMLAPGALAKILLAIALLSVAWTAAWVIAPRGLLRTSMGLFRPTTQSS